MTNKIFEKLQIKNLLMISIRKVNLDIDNHILNPKNVFNLVALLLFDKLVSVLSVFPDPFRSFRVDKILLIVFCCFSIFLLTVSSKKSCLLIKLSYSWQIADPNFSWSPSSLSLLSLISTWTLEFKLISLTFSCKEWIVLLIDGKSKNC